jgi:uncharacterized protein YecE (DUF72 family)
MACQAAGLNIQAVANKRGRVRIGTSGWTYPHWRRTFYPAGLPQRRELEYLAQRLNSVEINGTFYSLTRPTACEGWRRAVGEDFLFAVKGSRYITHMLKLRKFEAPLANFFSSGILRLGRNLGPILWQLPPSLAFHRERVRPFFEALPRDMAAAERWARKHDRRTTGRAALRAPDGRDAVLRHAVEARHPSWFEDQALSELEALGLALVVADTAGRHPFSLARTAGFSYFRLHGSTQLYASRYEDHEIADWAARVRQLRDAGVDVHVYLDNDARANAAWDALRLRAAVEGKAPPDLAAVVSTDEAPRRTVWPG